MSAGMTIADFVQQVLYAMYKVRLDTGPSQEGSFHSKSDKFKEIVMEGNFVLQEFQKEQDWNFLRERWQCGPAFNPPRAIQEIPIPEGAYKVCTGYNDAVRLHRPWDPMPAIQVPFTSPRSGNSSPIEMHDGFGRANIDKNDQRAFVVGDVLTFKRPWIGHERGLMIETDVISRIEPLHICGPECHDGCPLAYEDRVFKWMPDPYYLVVRTAAKRAAADPSCSEMVQILTDEASKFLSAIRENDSAHTDTDTYSTGTIGYIPVL